MDIVKEMRNLTARAEYDQFRDEQVAKVERMLIEKLESGFFRMPFPKVLMRLPKFLRLLHDYHSAETNVEKDTAYARIMFNTDCASCSFEIDAPYPAEVWGQERPSHVVKIYAIPEIVHQADTERPDKRAA